MSDAGRHTIRSRRGRLGAWLWGGGIGCAALTLRLLYLQRLSHSPLGGSLTADAVAYWAWSEHILRHGIVGTAPFFLGPLYPYVLAALRLVTGHSVAGVLAVQMVWGSLACLLLADTARRFVGPWIGLAIGLLAASYSMAVFLDGLVLAESLLFALEATLLWWVVRTDWGAPRAGPAFVTGLLVGVVALGRASSIFLVLPALGLVAWRGRPAFAAARRHALALAAGVLAITAPVAARNLAVGGEWIPLTYNFGINLYVGNNSDANGTFVTVTGTHLSSVTGGEAEGGAALDGREYLTKTEGVSLSPAQSSAYWAAKAAAYARAHPGRVTALAFRKIGMLWNRTEYPQIENLEEYRAVVGPVGVPWIGSFTLLGSLAFAGLWFAARYGPAGRFLVGYAVVMTLAIVPFFVTDRYRHHLAPAALVLAGVALRELWMALRGAAAPASRRGARPAAARRPLAAFAALAVGVAIVHLPAPRMSEAKQAWGIAMDLGTRWMEQGRPDLALPEFDRAIRAIERDPRGLAGRGRMMAMERADLFRGHALALDQLGRLDEAVVSARRAALLAPGNAAIIQDAASMLRRAGQAAAADSFDARLPGLVGGEIRLLDNQAWAAARAGAFARAESLFRTVVARDPRSFNAWTAIVRLEVQSRRFTEAEATLARARAEGLPALPADAHEAFVAASRGDRAAAERALARLPAGKISDPVIANVVEVTRSLVGR